uniref:RecQ-mediated genome instability protein 1 n=1 Tax=Colletotrichum fructicola (strain Nara gc5) TaxID=1213859 RepID=L2FJY2_COLFN
MDATTQIRNALHSQSFPTPSVPWTTTLTSRVPTPPLPSLIATAKARLLASDLTTPNLLDPSSSVTFPPAATDPQTPETTLPRDVPCQVLDVENLALSRWEQVEELEAAEYDNVDEGAPGRTQAAAAAPQQRKNATHRLVLQDCKGQKVYAMELRRVDRIGVGVTNIGEKVMLKAGTVVARGTVLLEPEKCVMLGGKVDAWQKAWMEGRIARLKEAVGADRP